MYSIENLADFDETLNHPTGRSRKVGTNSSLELIRARSGNWTVRKKTQSGTYCFLHSSIDPQREARIWAENQTVITPRSVILGIGLGYHVIEFLKQFELIEDAFLIEADEALFQLATTINHFSGLSQNTAIHFLIGTPLSALQEFLSRSLTQPFSFHLFLPNVSLYPAIYNPIRGWLERHLCTVRSRKQDDSTYIHPKSLSFTQGVERVLNQLRTP